jgi:hypothetical protein
VQSAAGDRAVSFFLVVSRWNLKGGWFPIFFRDIGGLIGEDFDVVEEDSEQMIIIL